MKTKVRFSIILLFVLAILPFIAVSAQEQPISLHVDWVDTTEFPQVTVNLSAWGADGLPLADLRPDDFSLQEDGGAAFHPQVVEADPQAPLSVMLVLDISESMYGEPIDDAQDAATRFLDRLEPGDRAALIAFSDQLDPDPQNLDPSLELGFTNDLGPAYDLIETLSADGQTHLFNAAAKAVTLTANEAEGHRAILLLTDGRNEPAETGNPDEAIQLAQDTNVPFFVIGLGNQIDEPYLRRLANETGGLFRAAPKSSELAELFTDMAALLKTQYRLTYESNLPGDGETHTLEVTLNAAGGTDSESIQFGPLPSSSPTDTPTLTPTQPPTLTFTPTLTSIFIATVPPPPTSTPTATATPTPKPVTTFFGQIVDSVSLWIPALLLLFLIALLLLIFRKKPRQREYCAKCGYDVTDEPSACPQCGETRRLTKEGK